jgi:hypothetical protein
VAATVILLAIIWPLVWQLDAIGVVLANIASLLVAVTIMARGRRSWVEVDAGTYAPAFMAGLGALVLGLVGKWLMGAHGWVAAALVGLGVAMAAYALFTWCLERDRVRSELRYVRQHLRRSTEG